MKDKKPNPTTFTHLPGDSFEDDMLDSMERELLQELAATSAITFTPGQHIDGRFVLEEELGAGGMGWVFAARHLATGGQVALKVMNPRVGASGKQRFAMEARNAAMLTHPNTVRVLDYGQDGEHLFLVMEFLKGDSLDKVIKEQGRLSLKRTVSITAQVLKSLWEAHDHQIVHRDIKAGNIFLINQQGAQDFVKVLDFGISSNLKAPLGVTQGIIGSPYNMAPEQWEGKDVSPQTDLYAVGCLVYEMLSGQVPFYSDSLATLGIKHLQEAPSFDESRFTDSSIPLHGWIKRMMAKAPEDRPQSAKHALQALQDAAQTDLAISPRAVAPSDLSDFSPSAGPTPDAPMLSPDPASPQPRRHNLSSQLGHFIGRDAELAQLRTFLLEENRRLVTVVGLGGVGKTSLIQRFAHQNLMWWPGEVWFCDLTKVTSRQELLYTVAQVVGIKLTREDDHQQFMERLRTRPRPLLLLDNFEQITHLAPDTLGAWLEAVPDLTLLVSSREPLAIADEQVMRLLPFALPAIDASLEEAAGNHAVEVFINKASEVLLDFALTQDNARDIIALVRQLDGLPLALKMAAARVSVLTPAQIVQRLSQRFKLLRSQLADLSPHQTTLKNTLDWSWEMLLPWEKESLIQCSVFHGSFTLEAAEAVLDLSAWPDAPWTLDLLQNLLDKSWLTTDPQEDQQQTRFTFYVSIREYALYQRTQAFQSVPEGQAALVALIRRHEAYYGGLPLDGAAWERNFSPDNVCKKEHHNILALVESDDPDVACRATLALANYYSQYGIYSAATGLLRPWRTSPPEDPHQHVRFLLCQAFIDLDMGGGDPALFAQIIEMARDLGETVLEGWASQLLGSLQIYRDRQYANSLLVKAIAIGESTGCRLLQGWANQCMGNALVSGGAYALALKHHQYALEVALETRALVLECVANRAMALHQRKKGSLDKATDHYLRALEINSILGWRDLEGWLLLNLSMLYTILGEQNKVYQTIHRALEIARAIGHQRLEGSACLKLGVHYIQQGQRTKALEIFNQGLDVARELAIVHLEGVILVEVALIELEMGNLDLAQVHLDKALSYVKDNDQHNLGVLLVTQARLQHALGQDTLATQSLASAEEIFEAINGDLRLRFGQRLRHTRHFLSQKEPPKSG